MTAGPFQRIQHGIGRIVASSYDKVTSLTTVSHKAPVRLIPLRSSAVQNSNSAVCVLSNYGGGILPGDVLEYHVDVKEHAKLGLITQGSNRIYQQRKHVQISQTRLEAMIEANALLVFAPDPITPFANSAYEQLQNVIIDPSASLCFIDWLSSGRFANGERWQQAFLKNQTALYFGDKTRPILVDRTVLDENCGMDWTGVQFNAYASMILYGERVQDVVGRCMQAQEYLAWGFTKTRIFDATSATGNTDYLRNLSGRIIFSVSEVSTEHGRVQVARMAATSNEDLYRVFYFCLQPLASEFGFEFYKERIRATTTTPVVVPHPNKRIENDTPAYSLPAHSESNSSYWKTFILADSALPTGSFAHSSGLEAASQLGIISTDEDVSRYVNHATQSVMQLSTPFLVSCHRAAKSEDPSSFVSEWSELDAQCNAILASSGPARRASLDQGRSLIRLSTPLLASNSIEKKMMLQTLQKIVRDHSERGHLSTSLGAIAYLCGLSEIETCRLMGFCVARDVISAAVRLNLVGPLASVGLLAQAQHAAEKVILRCLRRNDEGGVLEAAACAPVIDAIQTCHDALAVRLFRS